MTGTITDCQGDSADARKGGPPPWGRNSLTRRPMPEPIRAIALDFPLGGGLMMAV